VNKAVSPSIMIVGTGAMACLLASRLAAAGVVVHILGTWAEGLAALKRDGVRLVHPNGSEQVHKVIVSANPRDFSGARFALVLVKSWQTQRAAQQLFECLSVDGVALTLQNGLGNKETLVAQLGAERAAFGVTTSGATLLAPGIVRAGGEGRISLEKHPRVAPIVDMLKAAGFVVELVEDANSLAWGKLVVNAAINPLAAVLDVPNGEILARTSARELSAMLAKEAADIAGQKGIRLNFADPVEAAENVVRDTSSNISSMLQDLRRGAPTEIDAICGAVVRNAREVGLQAPVNETMWKLVMAKEGRR
jgi:2-dehydropantoate 2-reductase